MGVLALVVIGLIFANLAAQLYTYLLQNVVPSGLVPLIDRNGDGSIQLIDLGGEANIPAWYSSSALLLCAALLAVIAAARKRTGDRYTLHWGVLSLVFVYLSLDEAAGIHERVSAVLGGLFGLSGSLYYVWVVPAAALLLVFVLVYLRFLADLPTGTRRLFLVAGAIFVGGALGLEMVEYRYLYDRSDVTYAFRGFEESFEMIGIVVFVYALMSYIGGHLGGVRLHIGDAEARKQAPDGSETSQKSSRIRQN